MTQPSEPVAAAPDTYNLMDCVRVLDPATLEVVRMKREHDDRTHRYDNSTKPGDDQ